MKSNRNDGQQKSCMSDNMKNFLLSLLATTISIALTFGTAAVIDNNKKEQEKAGDCHDGHVRHVQFAQVHGRR